MNFSRYYSHQTKFNSFQSKRKSQQKNTSYTPLKSRSVTYHTDEDLLKLIINNNNLLEVVQKLQKQRQVKQLVQEISSNSILPSISRDEKQQQIQYQKLETKRKDQIIPYSFQLNPKNIAYYQENKIYGKFIEPTEYKKIDYELLKTIEIARSKQFSKDLEQQMQLNQIKDIPFDQYQSQKLSKDFQIDNYKNKNYHQQENLNTENNDTILRRQSKINKILQNTQRLKQEIQILDNQQKIELKFEIKDEFQKYSDLNQNKLIQNLNIEQNKQAKMKSINSHYKQIIKK
ncbi:unnamed protein product [Paramecium sonneborni]|uniref:Uncharacterized protein n=1 Tax=Paramecium sonneborni TaxID=65129 RepID=A0A8S1K5G8_9CILI|nr:unnamed protein product [Paramecium sonneborni]